MSIHRSIVVGAFAISLIGCGRNAPDSAAAGAAAGQSAAAPSSSGAVPPALRSAIASTLKVDESKVIPAATFAADLGADELSMVELVMAYERTFEVEISNADADRFKKVQDVVDYLRRRNVVR